MADIVLAEWVREHMVAASLSHARSVQRELGPSDLGHPCDRKLVYALRGTPPVNLPDPMKTTEGHGIHYYMAEYFRTLPGGRYLVEFPVTYRGVRGSIDLFDRYKKRIIDWKSTQRSDLVRRYRREGLPQGYLTQISIYVEGLRAAGEDVQDCALVFIPRGAKDMADVSAFVVQPDSERANTALDRYENLSLVARGEAEAAAIHDDVGHLCPYCPWYRPGFPTTESGCAAGKVQGR
jgi:hypothetical protein